MISLDSLRFLRKKKFWIALSSVLVIILMIFVNIENGKYTNYEARSMEDAQYIVYQFREDEDYVNRVQKVADRIEPALKKKDWRKVNQTISDLYVIQAANILMLSENDNESLFYHDYLRGKEKILKIAEERNLPVVTEDVIDSTYEVGNFGMTYGNQFPILRLQAEYFQQLSDQNIESLNMGTIDSSTIFVQFLSFLFPLLPILIAAIMCYDTMQEDRDSGVVKLLLTQPKKRSVYLHKKIMLNIKAVSAIFIVPLIIISLCYGIFDHYSTIKAPVLANAQGITSLEMQDNTISQIEEGRGGVGQIGITRYYPIPAKTNSPNPELDFIEMWQFVGLCMIMAVFIIAFFVILNTLFAIITKNKILALVLSLIVSFIGMFISNPANMGTFYAYMPFTYMNPVNIVSGFSSYTYLNGILVLCIASSILYFLCIQIFKRKDSVA